MTKLKGKAEPKFDWQERASEKSGFHEYGFARFLEFMAENLDWEERQVRPENPEAKMVMHSVDMEVRLQDLEKKHQDLKKEVKSMVKKEVKSVLDSFLEREESELTEMFSSIKSEETKWKLNLLAGFKTHTVRIEKLEKEAV